jgi:hypothetical protein
MQNAINWVRVLLCFFVLSTPAVAWDPFDASSFSETEDDWADTGEMWDEDEREDALEDEVLDNYVVTAADVYLICIYGPRDDGSVPRKCTYMQKNLKRMYPRSNVVRFNNPSQATMEDLQRRVGKDIGVIIVVTHSTPLGPDKGWDVWDCPLQPEDIADIFDDKWVIWNGCYSADICKEADNILPVQCESDVLPERDDTWRKVVRCLERTAGSGQDRDEVCDQVFGNDWDE